ncbi:MAG: hypothetical protein C0594_14905 [Marinilabiliales bacterium]|nr:MAG: hypothetical protein C0594_14905 [Marinilabiliales bacterium]
MNTRQTQTYLSTTDNKIVSHNVKDFKGNTAVEVLPIPKNGRLNEYEDELVKDGDGGLYNAFDFDLEPDDPLVVNYHLDAPSPITGDVNDYYSETNPDKQVPNAEGYPFSRTVVSNDPANKVIEQASPGRHHMLGAQTDDATTNMGRTIRTQYSTPSDAELVRVFGDEAPDCNNVLKVETIDPNNTKTISYISEEGKIIATCLSSNEGDDLLLNIDTYPGNNNNKFAVANSTSENTEIENGLVSVKNVSFSETTPISLDYTISCEVIEMLCVSIAGDCEYLVVFTISGLDNDYYLTDTVSLDTIDCLGDPMLKSVTWPFEDEVDDVDIQAGSYKFTKQLIVNGDLSDQVQTATADISDQIYPLVAMVSSWLTGVQNQGDLDQVYTNIDNFNTQIFEAWQSGDLPDNTTDPNNKFVILKQDFSLPVDFIFNSGHVLEKIYQLNSEDPPQTVLSSINIWGGCCGPISVPLFYENPFNSVCKEPAEYLADLDALGGPGTNYVNMETVGPDFEAYMLEQLQTAEWDDLMPGYRPGEFNRMIFHMLTDSYAPMGQTAEEPQYTCEELWGSWMALIAVFDSVEENMVGQYDMSEHTGEQYDPPSDEHQDNHYDINAGLYGGDLGDWLLNTALSIMVRDDEHNVTINAWLPELFLQDVGYKYARILIREQDGTFRPGWEPLAADQSEYFAAPYNIPNVYEEEYPDSFENLIYSNVYNPIFAFKYYEYTDHSYPDCEGAYCYWGPVDTDPLIANDGYGFCTQEPCLNLSYVNWNYTDARGFYDCIKDRDPFVAPDPPLSGLNSCTDVLAHEDYTQAALEANRLDLIDGCHEACEARKDQIFDYLYNLFEENCYRIDQPCPEDPDVISTADIWVIVDTLVNRCKNDYCPDPASASDFCYCKDWDVTCLTTDYVNRTLIPNSNYWELKYLSDCEAQKKEIISTWLLEIAIISQCPGGATTLPGWTDQTTCETKPASCYPSSTVDDPGNPVTSTQIDVESDVQY